MCKIFISQPMRNRDAESIANERKAVESWLETIFGYHRVEIIDSYFVDDDEPRKNKPLYDLGKSFSCLSEADAAVFCPGWEDARGCRLEYAACRNYDIPIIGFIGGGNPCLKCEG